jgi:hypothetical protein
MPRRLLNIASVVCLVACVALLVLWARSYRAFDRASGRLFGRVSVICVSYAGRMTTTFTDPSYLSWSWPKHDSGPILPHNRTLAEISNGDFSWSDTDVVWPHKGKMGFGWIQHALCPNMPNGETGWGPRGMSARSWAAASAGVMVPHSFGVLIFASLASLPWMRWRFSLRTLFIATTFLAVVLGMIAWLDRAWSGK